VATPEQVEQTVRALVQRLGDLDPDLRRKHAIDRTVSCRVTDLEQVWSGRLCDGVLLDVTTSQADKAQVRLAIASDDLISLAEGRLSVAQAWATGRLRVQAGPLDLLKLRTLL
jgi:hypothetical protein